MDQEPPTISLQPATISAPRPVATVSSATDVLDTVLFCGMISLVLFAPLAYGAVESWAVAVLEVGSVILLALWAANQALQRRVSIAANPLYRPMLLFGGLVAAQIVLHVSAYRNVTVTEAWKYTSFGIFMFLANECFQNQRRLRWFIKILAVFGMLVAIFALAQDFTSADKLYWFRVPRHGGSVFGPYVNRNHYAGLMEMLTPFALLLAIRDNVQWEKRLLYGFAAVLMGTSIFVAGSRGGMLAILFELLFLASLGWLSGTGKFVLVRVATIALFTTALLVWLNAGGLVNKLGALDDPVRLSVARDSLRMVAQRPIAGWGLGTFPVVYPRFRSFFTDVFINQAHNDYVQLAVETGLIGIAAAAWFFISAFGAGFRNLRGWQSRTRGLAAMAGLTACTGILVHSLFDFNLHIPANALLFFVICALVTSQHDSSASL